MKLFLAYVLALFLQAPVPPRLPAPEVKFFGYCEGRTETFKPSASHEVLYLSPKGDVMFWTFGVTVCLPKNGLQLPKEMQ